MIEHALIEPCEHCPIREDDYRNALERDRLHHEVATLRRQLDQARYAYEQLMNGARGDGDEGSDV